MNSTKITDVFFDLDHTLWDFDKNSELTYQLIFNKLDWDIDLSHFISVYQRINIDLWKLYREDKIEKEALRYKRLNDTFSAMNKWVSDQMINKIADDYIANLSMQTHLIDGALNVLEYLSPKYNLHIITNGFQEVQKNKLNNSKLESYFDIVVDSEMVGVKKPNPKIFEVALEMANVDRDNAVMVGDNYEADILGALNIGLDAICYNYHKEDIPSNIKQINHLNDLLQIL